MLAKQKKDDEIMQNFEDEFWWINIFPFLKGFTWFLTPPPNIFCTLVKMMNTMNGHLPNGLHVTMLINLV